MSEQVRELTLEDALRLAVALARTPLRRDVDPQPGDLVVEASWMRGPDPDAIGWLVGHGEAPHGRDDPLDGSVPMREVWDVIPLNPTAVIQYTTDDGRGYQRWENARFYKVPEHIVKRMGWDYPQVVTDGPECSCAMTEASMWACEVHGLDGELDREGAA